MDATLTLKYFDEAQSAPNTNSRCPLVIDKDITAHSYLFYLIKFILLILIILPVKYIINFRYIAAYITFLPFF
jgi:hypothetical protein